MLSKSKTGDRLSPAEFFSERLRATRQQKNLDQTELAEITGIPATSISHFETKRRRPSAGTLYALAEALDVSMDFLVGRTDKPLLHRDFDSYLREGAMRPEDQVLLLAMATRLQEAARLEEVSPDGAPPGRYRHQ